MPGGKGKKQTKTRASLLKTSRQRSVANITGLLPQVDSDGERESKRQRRKSAEILVEKIATMTSVQNTKARRTKTRHDQTECLPLESVNTLKSNKRGGSRRKKRAPQACEDDDDVAKSEEKDVYEVLLDKTKEFGETSSSSSSNKSSDSKAAISLEERDAREVYNTMDKKLGATKSNSLISQETEERIAKHRSINILPSTQPWSETLRMIETIGAQDLPSTIFTEFQERRTPSASSVSKSKRVAGASAQQKQTANDELKSVWGADTSAILFYISQLTNWADVQTSESLRRALARPSGDDPHLCTREHVDRVLCCPEGPFRPCALGDICVAKLQFSLLPKPLMEYLSPSEYESIAEGLGDPRPIGTSNFCYICLLYFYNREHYFGREKGPSVVGMKPQFYHTVAPGEYNHAAMIENLTGAEDTRADEPMVNCSVTGFENCGGLVTPLRKLIIQDYAVVTAKRVTVKAYEGRDETAYTVFGLQETDPVFVKHATTKVDPDPLDPYIRLRHIISHRPDMWEIMQYYFSVHNRVPSIGISRLRNAHQAKTEVITLPVYWGVLRPVTHARAFAARLNHHGFEPFPFQWVFCEDITQTATHLEAILRGGRIHLSYLYGQEHYREVMNHPTDIDTPIDAFSDALSAHPYFSERRLLTAYLVRQQVYAALLSLYPSNTECNDASIHKRLTIMHNWNKQQYGYLLENPVRDADIGQLRPIDPLPFYFFASDIDFYRVRTEVVLKRSPREFMIHHFGDHPAFLEFKEMRRSIRDRKFYKEEVIGLWIEALESAYFFHPHVPTKLTVKDTPSFLLYDLLCNKYTVLWCLLVRVAHAHNIATREEEKLEVLTKRFEKAEERFLSQPNEQDIAEAVATLDNEPNKRKATRIKATINKNTFTRAQVESYKQECIRQREIVYQIYCFIYTHLDLAERSVDLRLLKDQDFFQTSIAVPSAEKVALEKEMMMYQGRPVSICCDPLDRLAVLLSHLRKTKPKFVSRVVSHYPTLYVNPLTGLVGVHAFKTSNTDAMRCFSVIRLSAPPQFYEDVPDVCAFVKRKTIPQFYRIGSSDSEVVTYGSIHDIEVEMDSVSGEWKMHYTFSSKRFLSPDEEMETELSAMYVFDDAEYAVRALSTDDDSLFDSDGDEQDIQILTEAEQKALEKEMQRKAEEEEDEAGPQNVTITLYITGNGKLLDERAAQSRGIDAMCTSALERKLYSRYPPFPRNPNVVDRNGDSIDYDQKDIDEYFREFLDPLIHCLNTACLEQERKHLTRHYIEMDIKETGEVIRNPLNYGKIRQVTTERQFSLLRGVIDDAPNQMITHYTECYPDDRKTIHEGMLPNLTSIIGCINFVDDNSAEPKSNTRNPSAIIYMLRKMYPKCCQSRKKNEKHVVACKDNISYLMLVRECFLVTMLGAYRHANKRPVFMKALEIYKLMRSHFNVERFFEDQKRFPSLFTFCVTEALMVWTRSALAYYHYILSRYPIYVRFEKTVYLKADKVRKDFGKGKSVMYLDNFIDERELFASDSSGAASSLLSFSKNHVYRRTCFNPIYRLRAYITEILNKPRFRNRPEMPPMLRKAIIHRVYSLEPNSDIDMISILGEFNAFYPEGVTPKVSELNIQPCTEVILYWVLRLMANAAPEESIKELMERMPPKDMEVFDLFINTLARHYSINVFKLPEFVREQQELALKRAAGAYDPSIASGSLIVSSCCWQKKTYDSREKCKSAHLQYGSRLMALDMRDGYSVHCCSKKDADIERKHNRMRKEQQKEIDRAVITGKSKEEIAKIVNNRNPDWKVYATYRYQPKCGDNSRAQVYSLIGYVVQIVDSRGITNAFTVCLNCGSVCGFSRRMYDVNWFSCMTCEMNHVLKMRTPRCVACRHFLKLPKSGKTNWRHFLVFNDSQVPITYTFDTFYVCDRCYGTKTSYFKSDIIYTTSELKAAKYAHEQRAVFDLREGSIDVHQVIDYYYENHSIRLNHPSTKSTDWDDSDDESTNTRRRHQLLQYGPTKPYDSNSNYYGNFRSIDMRNGDGSAFSNFFSVLDGAIFPPSLTDSDVFRIEATTRFEI